VSLLKGSMMATCLCIELANEAHGVHDHDKSGVLRDGNPRSTAKDASGPLLSDRAKMMTTMIMPIDVVNIGIRSSNHHKLLFFDRSVSTQLQTRRPTKDQRATMNVIVNAPNGRKVSNPANTAAPRKPAHARIVAFVRDDVI
jgi:hypothetical protein